MGCMHDFTILIDLEKLWLRLKDFNYDKGKLSTGRIIAIR